MGTVVMNNATVTANVDVDPNAPCTLAICPGSGGNIPADAVVNVYWRTTGSARGAHVGTMSGAGRDGIKVIDAGGTYLIERTPGDYTVERN